MRYIILMIFTPFILFSYQNKNKEVVLISKFVKKYIVNNNNNNNNDFEGLENYFNPMNEKKLELIKEILKVKIQELTPFKKFKIINHNKLHNNIKLKMEVIYKKNKVYYLVIDKEVKMFFIVEDMKIISFMPGLQKKESNNIYPVIFNKD